ARPSIALSRPKATRAIDPAKIPAITPTDYFARRELLRIDRKGAQDLVSEADGACEDLIVTGLAHLFPRDGFLRQERGARNPDAAALWVINPIDGTHNFLTGQAALDRMTSQGCNGNGAFAASGDFDECGRMAARPRARTISARVPREPY